MQKPHILIVDDDAELCAYIKEYLLAKDIETHVCGNAQLGLGYLESHSPDLCVLDIEMPVTNGFELAKSIAEKYPYMPFLFLTGQSDRNERIKGLQLGADDYITKPFSLEELFLRIKVVLKRTQDTVIRREESHRFSLGKLLFDSDYQRVEVLTETFNLSDIENKLLSILCQNLNEEVQRDFILKAIWGENDYYKNRSLNVYVTRLRKLLALEPNVQLLNLHGKGYKLVFQTET